jgi:glycosyltransferase involved in cell wall biosynthesis
MKDVTQCILENRIRVIFNHSVDVNALLEASVYVRADRAACPWGRDIIEAMWVGLPVVATGTSEEFVQEGHTGFLVPPYRPDLMADRVCRLLNDTDLRKAMGRKGFIRGRKMFSPELHKEKLLKVFNINRT